MHPFIELGPWRFGSYLPLLVLGLTAGTGVAVGFAPRFHVSRLYVVVCASACAISGYLGAWAYSGLIEVGYAAWMRGAHAGLSIHGGLIAGVLVGAAASRAFSVPFWRFLDLTAVVLPLGLAFGRTGCLLAGCCYGKPTRFIWAIVYEDFAGAARPIGVPLHPTPIYLALGGLAIFGAVVSWRLARRRFEGQLVLEVLAAVSLLRFMVEFLRADNRGPVLLLHLPWAQWTALGICGVAITLRIVRGRRHRTRTLTSRGANVKGLRDAITAESVTEAENAAWYVDSSNQISSRR